MKFGPVVQEEMFLKENYSYDPAYETIVRNAHGISFLHVISEPS